MSVIANLLLQHTGDERRFPDELFENVFHLLFPNNAEPTLGEIMKKDLSTGIDCFAHLGLPLPVAPAHLMRCLLVTIGGQIRRNRRLMKQVKALKLTELVVEMATCGRVNARWVRKLVRLRDKLRMKRNRLQDDPTTAQTPQVEGILRQLELLVGLEAIVREGHNDAAWRDCTTLDCQPYYNEVMRGWLKIWASIYAKFEAKPPPGSPSDWGHFTLSTGAADRRRGVLARTFLTLYEEATAPQPSNAACLAHPWPGMQQP
jgi:hypothetical protein